MQRMMGLHDDLAQRFFLHQQALLDRDFVRAALHLAGYRERLLWHMQDEEGFVLPRYVLAGGDETEDPGRADHPDYAVARRLFGGQFGNMVTFELAGGREAVNRFMRALDSIPFAPTLGDVSTIISHPAVTSHRGLTAEAREALGIREGTIRVSVGVEEFAMLEEEFGAALSAVGTEVASKV